MYIKYKKDHPFVNARREEKRKWKENWRTKGRIKSKSKREDEERRAKALANHGGSGCDAIPRSRRLKRWTPSLSRAFYQLTVARWRAGWRMRDDSTPARFFIAVFFRGCTFWVGVIWFWCVGGVSVRWGWWFTMGFREEGGRGRFQGKRRASGNAAPWDQRERYLPDTFCRRFFTRTGLLAFKGFPRRKKTEKRIYEKRENPERKKSRNLLFFLTLSSLSLPRPPHTPLPPRLPKNPQTRWNSFFPSILRFSSPLFFVVNLNEPFLSF